MKLNLFFSGVDSEYGYQSDLLNRIDERVHFDTCVMTIKCADGRDHYPSDKYVTIPYDICEHNHYQKICDMNDLEPLSEKLLMAMKLYEGTIIHMLIRNMEVDVYTYEEAYRLYLRHLRFWNDMLEKHGVNFVIFSSMPHHAHDYVIYSLAKIKKIPMCLNFLSKLGYWYYTGEDYHNIGDGIAARYEVLEKEGAEAVLSDEMEKRYQSMIVKSDRDREKERRRRQEMYRQQGKIFWDYAGASRAFKRNFKRLKSGVKQTVVKRSFAPWKEALRDTKQDVYFLRRIRLKRKNMRGLNYYNSLTGQPDYQEKYVIFFLQYQPEASTLPQAGVFVEQLIQIQMLAHVLEKMNICLYVKEHFVQHYRDKNFYDDLAAIRNVKLIHTEEDSKDLMLHSIATSTCTGTMILESIINGKPCLVFSDSGFAKGPGIYKVASVQECEEAIRSLGRNGSTVRAEQVRRYLQAFEEKTYQTDVFINHHKENDEFLETCKQNSVKIISESIKQSFQR